MDKTDIKKLNKCLKTIRIKECNDLPTDKEYFDLYDICSQYRPKDKWEYPRLKEISPFPLKAMEELTEMINQHVSTGVISEDCYDDITMLSIILSHLSAGIEEYHYSEFDWLLSREGDLTDTEKIKILNDVINLLKEDMSKEKYLTLSNVLCLVIF